MKLLISLPSFVLRVAVFMTIIGYDVADVYWGAPQGYVGVFLMLGFVSFPLVFIGSNELFMAPRRVGALLQGG